MQIYKAHKKQSLDAAKQVKVQSHRYRIDVNRDLDFYTKMLANNSLETLDK